MKKLTLSIICAMLAIAVLAQAPQGISHQAVIRNAANELVSNAPIGIQVSILQGSAQGIAVYTETHIPISNANGLISFVIGQGNGVDDFSAIDWAAGPYFIKTEADPAGGMNYTITGTSQMLSVPYALHAKTAETHTQPINESDPVYNAWDKSTGIVITEGQIIDLQDYLTQEFDPEFNAWDKSTGIVITEGQIIDLQEYLTQEFDPEFNAWDKSTGIVITEGQIIDLQEYLTQEFDPEFNAWDKSSGIVITEGQIIDLQEYLTQEVDPDFNAWDKSTGIVITEGQIVDLQEYLTQEFDPEFNAWDKSTGIVITEGQIIDLQDYLTQEFDPEFNAWDKSTGIVITENQITDLKDYLTEETDPVFSAWDKTEGITINESQIIDLQNYLMDILGESIGDLADVDLNGLAAGKILKYDAVIEKWVVSENDLQTVSQHNYQVTLSRDGGSFMTGVKSYAQEEIDAMAPYNGLTVHNSTTNCINYYFLNNWFEACGTCTPQPTQAEAGNDTIVQGGDLSVNLNANTPEMGEGLWTILIGEGGTLDDTTNPQALFTGQPFVDYTLQWAIATACDTSSDEVSVTFNPWQCGMPITDERDDQSYETVQLGDQCWMAENLKYLPAVVEPGTGSNTEPYYYVYGYNGTSVSAAKATANYQTYGALYNWPAALTACPTGWHLPIDAEWTALTTFVSSQPAYLCNSNTSYIAKALAATTNWSTTSNTCDIGNNLSANNATGFSGLPGGYRGTYGAFSHIGVYGYWWSATETSTTFAWLRYLFHGNADVGSVYDAKGYGFSVRCVRDETSPPTTYNLNIEINPAGAGTVTGAGQYEADEEVNLTAEANPGWEFVNWTDDDGIVSHAANFTYTMPAEDITLTANFIEEQAGFTCGSPFTDSRDNQSYNTIQIGTQCWMAENLKYLPSVVGSGTGSNTEPYYYVYGYNGTSVSAAKATANYQTYGALYNWPASVTACPTGWHLPSDAEWTALTTYVSSQAAWLCNSNSSYIAKALAATTNWSTTSNTCAIGNNLSANSAAGFLGLPGGYRDTSGTFYLIGFIGYWWSAAEYSATSAWSRYLYYDDAYVFRFDDTKGHGFSVRCVRD